MSDPGPPSVLKRKVPWWIWLPTTLLLSWGVVYLRFEVFLTDSERAHRAGMARMDSISAAAERADSVLKSVTPPKQRELMARMNRLCDAMRSAGRDSASLDLADFAEPSGLVENWVGHVYLSGSRLMLMNSPVDFMQDSIGDSLRRVAEPLQERAARFSARLLNTEDVDACLPAFPVRLAALAAVDAMPANAAAHP